VAAAGLILATPVEFWRSAQPWTGDLVDLSWMVDLPLRLARGEWSGIHFVFTYGPLYQVMHGLGLVAGGGDVASVMRYHGCIEAWLVALGVWGVLRAGGGSLVWRSVLYLFWLAVWPPSLVVATNPTARATIDVAGFKPLGGVLACAWCGWLLARSVSGGERGRGLLRMGAWGVSGPIVAFYAIDLAVVVAAALVVLAVMVGGWPGRAAAGCRRRGLECLSALACGMGVSLAAWSMVSGGVGGMESSWGMLRGYSRAMAWPFPKNDDVIIGMVLVGMMSVLGSAGAARHVARGRGGAASGLVLGGLIFCGLWLRYALSLSDEVHLLRTFVPALFVGGCLVPGVLGGRGRSGWAGASLAVFGLAMILVSPAARGGGLGGDVVERLSGPLRWDGGAARVAGLREADRAAIELAGSVTSDSLFVWPHEVIYGAMAGKRNAWLTVQPYAALTRELEQLTAGGMGRSAGVPVLVSSHAGTLVGVEHLGRATEVVRELLLHYELAARPAAGKALLRRTPAQRGWRFEDVLDGPRVARIDRRERLDVDVRGRGIAASDILELSVRIEGEGGIPGLAKPGRLRVTFVMERGPTRSSVVLAGPGRSSQAVLASGCTIRDPLWLTVWHPRRLWRATERVKTIELRWEALDGLSARPREMFLERVQVWRREGVEVLEGSMEAQDGPGMAAWSYGDVEGG
jgi:hypothetical protein